MIGLFRAKAQMTDEKSYQLSFYADKHTWKNKLLFFFYQIEKNSFKVALHNAYEDSATWSVAHTAGGMVNLSKLYNEQIENMSQTS